MSPRPEYKYFNPYRIPKSRRENVSHSFHVLTLTRCAVQESSLAPSSAGATPKVYSAFSRGVAGAHRGTGGFTRCLGIVRLATRVFTVTLACTRTCTHAHTGQAVRYDSLT